MPKTKKPLSSSARRRQLVLKLGMASLSKRSCGRCSSSPLNLCHTGEDSDRCVECVRAGVDCDLSPINVPKWKRLEERRKRLRKERSEAMARLMRLDKEIESIEENQERMVQRELRNIQELEVEEAALATAGSEAPSSLFDGFDLPEGFDWSAFPTSHETPVEAPGSSQGS